MEDFSSYGQVSPGAIQYRNTDPTRELDQLSLSMELQHVDRMIKAQEIKESKMQELSKQLAGAKDLIKGSSFITPENMGRVNSDFMQAINGIKEHYRTPSPNRDVAWHTELETLKNSLVPQHIHNDKKNQAFYDKIEQLRLKGDLSSESFDQWNRRFMEIASQGEDYMEVAQRDGFDPFPILSKENFIQSGTQLMNTYGGFTRNDFTFEGGRYVIKRSAVEKWVKGNGREGGTGRALWQDAKSSFYNLPDHIKDFYSNDWREGGEMEAEAIEEYMIQTLRSSFRPIEPVERGGGADQPLLNPYNDHVQPMLEDAIRKNLNKDLSMGQDFFDAVESLGKTDGTGIKSIKRAIPNVTSMFNATPANDGKRTRVQVALRSDDGTVFDLQIPLDRGMMAEWGYKDHTGSYDTEIFPINIEKDDLGKVSSATYGMMVSDVPIVMNKTNLDNLIMSMNGQEFGKFFKGTQLEEASGINATDKITVKGNQIRIGTRTFNKDELMNSFLTERESFDYTETPMGDTGLSMKNVIREYRIPATVLMDDPDFRRTQYNLSFGSHKGIGTTASKVDLNR